jgi:hypothetical protein
VVCITVFRFRSESAIYNILYSSSSFQKQKNGHIVIINMPVNKIFLDGKLQQECVTFIINRFVI